MRRFSKASRSQSWSAMSIDSAPIGTGIGPGTGIGTGNRSSRSKSPALSTRSSGTMRDYDTGFPEPFCGSGNTTLRHPSANTSPDFFISSDDIDIARVYHRSRLTFLTNKNDRTTLSHGKLDAYGHFRSPPSSDYNDHSSIVEHSPPRTGRSFASDNSSSSRDSNDSSRFSKDERDRLSLDHHGPDRHETSTSPSRPATSHSAVRGGGGGGGGGNIFRKLRLHE